LKELSLFAHPADGFIGVQQTGPEATPNRPQTSARRTVCTKYGFYNYMRGSNVDQTFEQPSKNAGSERGSLRNDRSRLARSPFGGSLVILTPGRHTEPPGM